MKLSPSDFYRLHQTSRCELRVHLDASEIEPSELGPFQSLLIKLGQRHEESHFNSFDEVTSIPEGTPEERIESTKKAIEDGAPVIYQPYFEMDLNLGGKNCKISGVPDFLIRSGEGYLIRDVKLSKRILEKDHPEIFLQLGLYGFLFENIIGTPPAGLEVFSGASEIISLNYDGGVKALFALEEIALIKLKTEAPDNAVGWTKCQGCDYRYHCWPVAVDARDVALVPNVFQSLALVLNAEGIFTFDDLVDRHTEETLSEIKIPWGKNQRRIGKTAEKIMPIARALKTNTEEILFSPEIEEFPNYVMFDLEGLPPYLDYLQKIYLWGMQVFGESPSDFKPALAGFGPEGDLEGWQRFLEISGEIFEEYGDIPFVHWHHYEKTNIKMYIERYGDTNDVAKRVLDNLLDLLPITSKAVAPPVYSYSLKVIEQYVGFERQENEYGGEWSIAKYIEATETENPDLRDEVMDLILAYNREDLEATWAVLKWLLSKK